MVVYRGGHDQGVFEMNIRDYRAAGTSHLTLVAVRFEQLARVTERFLVWPPPFSLLVPRVTQHNSHARCDNLVLACAVGELCALLRCISEVG